MDTAQIETAPAFDAGILRGRIMREVDRRPDLLYSLYNLGAPYVQLALLVWLIHVPFDGVFWSLGFILAAGWTQFRLYFPLHEACHFVLFESDAANRLAGRVLAATLFTTFSTFTEVHMQHHRLYGRRDDPGSVDYWVRFDGRASMASYFLRPLFGFSVLEKVWTNAADPLLRTLGLTERFAAGRSRSQGPARAPTIEPVDLAYLVAVQLLIFLAFSGLGERPLAYLLYFVLPGGTVFLFLARLRMYVEHGPLDYAVSDYLGDNRRVIARTHLSNAFERPLLSYMNFHYHWEHHLVPSLPSVRLPEVHRRYTRDALVEDDYSPTFAASLHRLLRLPGSRPEARG